MKIVLDSNVIVAAFGTRGLCKDLFELCLDRYEIIINDLIVTEIKRALNKKFKIPKSVVDDVIHYLEEFCTIVNHDIFAEKVCRDPSDDNIIALAVSGKAEYIITGDKDLLIIKKYRTVSIVTPREFWSYVSSKKIL